jgi:hypothetical protein
VRKKLEGELPFKLSGDQYEDSSLERLIDAFSKLSDNEELVKALRKFKDERNLLSHKAIVLCIYPDGEFDESSARDMEPKLDAIEKEAERIWGELHKVEGRVMVNLYFDKIPPVAG